MPNTIRQIIFLMLQIVGIFPILAGEKEILIHDKSYIIKTMFGSPIHHSDEFLKIIEVKPVFGTLNQWRTNRQTWTMHIKFLNKKLFGIISIKSLLHPKFSSALPIYIDARDDQIVVMIFEFFSKRSHPATWEFLMEDGDTWIPFECQVTFKNPQISYSFIEWAKVTAKDKQLLQKYEKAQIDAMSELPIKQITISKDLTIEIPFENGEPYRYADANFQVDRLSPAFDQKAKNGTDPWIWTISGRIRDLGPCLLEIFDPISNDKPIAIAELNGDGEWHLIFGEKSKTSNLWQWENNKQHKFVAIKLKLTIKNTNEIKEWYEVCQIDKNIRRIFSEFKK